MPEVVGAVSVLIPLALAAGASPRLVGRVDRLLAHTVSLAGLSGLVVAVYLLVVLGLGQVPSEPERALLLLSMAAAAVCALLYHPARQRLTARYDMSLPVNQRKLEAAEALGRLVEEAGLSLIEMAIAFVLNQPAVTSAIIGPRTLEHLEGARGCEGR